METEMKKLALTVLLIAPMISAADKKHDAADYTISVHVQASYVDASCGSTSCSYSQRLIATINGKRYELRSRDTPTSYLLHLGDYKARIFNDSSDQPYEYFRSYEFLFPGDKTQIYSIIGEEEQPSAH
jgi:hypothetical protein